MEKILKYIKKLYKNYKNLIKIVKKKKEKENNIYKKKNIMKMIFKLILMMKI